MNILQDLEFRDLIYQSTDYDELSERLEKGPIALYIGFDPTADSLHIGSLLPILCLKRFQLAGHLPIALAGGGTGMIGDPSGKSTERGLNPEEIIDEWTEKIRLQLEQFLDFDTKTNPARIANNYHWLGKLEVISFLRDIGKHFSIGYMLSKDAVKSRLSTGISYTEFSYMILQSYDFLKLYEDYDCEMQAGGSDQWGNITAGIELIRRVSNKKGYGLTFPLVTKNDGTKFGKTEAGTIWLDSTKTTPYEFFQFWINTDDRDVIRFIKYFTFLSRDEIVNLEEETVKNPGKREAHRILAREVTELVHGKEALAKAEKISQAFFYGNVRDLNEDEVEEGFKDIPSTTISENEIGIVDLLVTAGVSTSKRQAREDIKNKAIYINDECSTEIERILLPNDRLHQKYTIIRRGKKNYFLIKWLP
ncbi:MAG: tyrosine--tRNA ligase [Bacillota bacterium]|nr:tyrosine--tRNA ligase [Bacillota bacterium]